MAVDPDDEGVRTPSEVGAHPGEADPAESDSSPPSRSASVEEVALETERYRRLQRAVDVALALIYQSVSLTPGEAIDLILGARRIALSLFPGSEETFDLLYRPRLMRAISERFGLERRVEDDPTERGGD